MSYRAIYVLHQHSISATYLQGVNFVGVVIIDIKRASIN